MTTAAQKRLEKLAKEAKPRQKEPACYEAVGDDATKHAWPGVMPACPKRSAPARRPA